jgi:IS1 family transposase
MKKEKRDTILRLLVEGNSIRSVTRLMETNIPSVLRQLLWAGFRAQWVMDQMFKNLTLEHVEADEVWTFVAKKQARLTTDERLMRSDIGDMYLWTGLDQKTKLIPTFLVGKRSADNARRFMMDLASCLAWPTVHESDPHAFRPGEYRRIIQISTDAFAGYPEAVDLAFGPYVKYGVIVKDYRNARIIYTPSEMVGTSRRGIRGIDSTEERSICTSHVERNNLTVRTFIRRFARLSLGFSKKLANLEAAIALHMLHYNFCWRPGKMRITPAMAAQVTDRFWTFGDLIAELEAVPV